MSDELDLSDAIEKIQEMFASQEGREQISDIVAMFGGDAAESGSNNDVSGLDNIEMIMKISSIMSAMNSAETTSQVNFLKSLSQLLNPSKQEKINSAVKFLSMGKAIEVFKNM